MNGTGPTGQGSQTGRGMGRCAGGRRMMGRGGFDKLLSPVEQLKALEGEEKSLLLALDSVKAEKESLKSQK